MTPTDKETQIWISLNLAHRRIHRRMERALSSAGLPPLKAYDVLWAIQLAGADGVRASDMKDWLLFEQSALSRTLRGLIEHGLVRETICDTDKRAKTLGITTAGEEMRLKMWQVYGEQIHDAMTTLTACSDADALLTALQSLLPDREHILSKPNDPPIN